MALLPTNPENIHLDPNNMANDSVFQLIKSLGQLALSIAGGIAVIMIIWGAFQYFTAYGNEEKAAKAKTTITWAIIGVVVIVLAKVIIGEIFGLVTNTKPTFF